MSRFKALGVLRMLHRFGAAPIHLYSQPQTSWKQRQLRGRGWRTTRGILMTQIIPRLTLRDIIVTSWKSSTALKSGAGKHNRLHANWAEANNTRKSFKKTQWLINHLNSPAHRSTTYRCPGCNRLFKSLTAIASHAESASTRCRISASKAYPAFMDQLTAGIVQVNTNVHGDGTQSYSVSGGALNSWKERDGAK